MLLDDLWRALGWVALTLPLLIAVQRWLHRHLRGLGLLLTGDQTLATWLYALILLPGVFLHELSHWLTATLLGVKTGGFSLRPRQQADGSLQLGYVEYYRTPNLGPLRESLIGAAPLIFGTAAVVLISRHVFALPDVMQLLRTSAPASALQTLRDALAANDALVWLYLLFAISNAMMPSPSDRRAWPLLLLVVLALTGVLVLAGAGSALLEAVAAPLTRACAYLGLAFSITLLLDLIGVVLVGGGELIVSRLTGRRIEYG